MRLSKHNVELSATCATYAIWKVCFLRSWATKIPLDGRRLSVAEFSQLKTFCIIAISFSLSSASPLCAPSWVFSRPYYPLKAQPLSTREDTQGDKIDLPVFRCVLYILIGRTFNLQEYNCWTLQVISLKQMIFMDIKRNEKKMNKMTQ